MNGLTRQLVAKELHQYRWLMAGSVVAGLVGLGAACLGEAGFNVGFVLWLTALIALGVMLAIFGVQQERKERVLLFVLSLPLSPGGYVRTKLLGLLACYLLPWGVLSCAALTLVAAVPGIPDGLLPYGVLLSVFLLLEFAIVLSGALHIRSDGGMGALVIVTNMGVSVFMTSMTRLPDVATHMLGAEPVWNAGFWWLLAIELGATLVALALPLLIAARRRDIV